MPNPILTARISNPRQVNNKYLVDFEVKADVPSKFQGGNIRFFYDSTKFGTVVKFVEFREGYGPLNPTGSGGITNGRVGNLASRGLFSFDGAATYLNGAVDLKVPNKAVELSGGFVKIFSIEFDVVSSPEGAPIVLDLEIDPKNGGFLPGSSGVVMAVVKTATQPGYVQNRVEQFNWVYTGTGATLPYGEPT